MSSCSPERSWSQVKLSELNLNCHCQKLIMHSTEWQEPCEARCSLAPQAIRTGLRSEMGLALQMFPPILCSEQRVGELFRDRLRSHSSVPYLLPCKPPQHLQQSRECPRLVLCTNEFTQAKHYGGIIIDTVIRQMHIKAWNMDRPHWQ